MEEIKPKSDAQKAQELDKLKVWVGKLLGGDADKYDVQAKYDSSLTINENKTEMRKDLKHLVVNLQEQAENAKQQQERIEHEKIEAAEREVMEYNKNLVFQENKEIDQYYAPVYKMVNKMVQGYCTLGFVRGRGGSGKTHHLHKALTVSNADYIEFSGDVTEAYLYRLLFENNGKIIYFKETIKLLMALGSMNLLKAASETQENRVLTKSNYSKEQSDLPDRFLCRCKFIFDYNNLVGIQNLKEDFEALVTRGDYVELAFSDDDIKNLMRLIASTDDEKMVTEYIISQFESNGLMRLNLRTQWKAFKTYEYAIKNNLDWKTELQSELKNISRIRALLYTLIGNKAIRTADLKRLLLKNELVVSLRMAHYKVNEWLYLEELYKWSEGDKDFYVAINPKPEKVN